MSLLKISPVMASKIMGESSQFIRCGLQRGRFPFGIAIKINEGKRYKYYINPYQFFKYLGRDDLIEQWRAEVKCNDPRKFKLERGE